MVKGASPTVVSFDSVWLVAFDPWRVSSFGDQAPLGPAIRAERSIHLCPCLRPLWFDSADEWGGTFKTQSSLRTCGKLVTPVLKTLLPIIQRFNLGDTEGVNLRIQLISYWVFKWASISIKSSLHFFCCQWFKVGWNNECVVFHSELRIYFGHISKVSG